MAVVILTASPAVLASPDLNNEPTVDQPVEEVVTELPAVEPTVEKREVVEEVAPVPPKPQPQQPVVHPVGCEHYRELVSKYAWNTNIALAVMKAESGCNPNAVGDQFVIRGLYAPSCGLMQIRTLQGRPSCEQLKDPTTNVAWAWKLYQASGWQPWSVCKNGKVSCY